MHIHLWLIVESYKKICKLLVVEKDINDFFLSISLENREITFLWLSQKQGLLLYFKSCYLQSTWADKQHNNKKKMPFSWRPTYCLPIEIQILTIWPWSDLDFGMTLTLFMTLASDKSNQVKTEVQIAKLAFFHDMTLTFTQWPWYDFDFVYDLDLRQVKPS